MRARFVKVKHSRGQTADLDSRSEVDRRLALGARTLSGWHLHGMDLTGHTAALAAVDPAGALLLRCELTPEQVRDLRARGAVVFPRSPDTPVEINRTQLYTPAELYDTTRYRDSLDAHAYGWAHDTQGLPLGHPRSGDLARSLHDQAIDTALERWRSTRSLVGVMGGHTVPRGTPAYTHAARAGHVLGATHTVASGGGPGAMEAANLGARLSGQQVESLTEAQELLAAAPSYSPDVDAWVAASRAVLERFPEARDSLGVPTWHYGHQPSNLFATAIAKYFRNSSREAILLEVCDAGIVFLPGTSGTVQEIFQDACENFYADEASVARMVLVGRAYWTETVPAWPLLVALARGHALESRIHLVDEVEEAAALVAA